MIVAVNKLRSRYACQEWLLLNHVDPNSPSRRTDPARIIQESSANELNFDSIELMVERQYKRFLLRHWINLIGELKYRVFS
jgi:hypothetical protein